jgi:hypothetical protein
MKKVTKQSKKEAANNFRNEYDNQIKKESQIIVQTLCAKSLRLHLQN